MFLPHGGAGAPFILRSKMKAQAASPPAAAAALRRAPAPPLAESAPWEQCAGSSWVGMAQKVRRKMRLMRTLRV